MAPKPKVYPANPQAKGVEADHPGFTLEEHYYPALEDPAKMADLKSKMTVADFRRMKVAGDKALSRKRVQGAVEAPAETPAISAAPVAGTEAPAAPKISAAEQAQADAIKRAKQDREEMRALTQRAVSGGFTAEDTNHFGPSIVVSRSRTGRVDSRLKEEPATVHPALALSHAESQPGMTAMVFQRTGAGGVGVIHHLARDATAAGKRGQFQIVSSTPSTESTFLQRFTSPRSHRRRDATRADLQRDILRTEAQVANLHAQAMENLPPGAYGMSLVARGKRNFLNMLQSSTLPPQMRQRVTDWYNQHFEDEGAPPPGHEGPTQRYGINSLMDRLYGPAIPERVQAHSRGVPQFTEPVYKQARHPETGQPLIRRVPGTENKYEPVYEQEQAKHPETGKPLVNEAGEPVMQNVVMKGGEPEPVMKWMSPRGLYDQLAAKRKAAVEPTRELGAREYDPEFHAGRLQGVTYARPGDQQEWAGRSAEALQKALGTVLPEHLRGITPEPDIDIDNPMKRAQKHEAALKAADITHPHHAMQVAMDRLEAAINGVTGTPRIPLSKIELDPQHLADSGFDDLTDFAHETVDSHPAYAPMIAEIDAAKAGRGPTAARPRLREQLLDIARAVDVSTLPGIRAQRGRQWPMTVEGAASGVVPTTSAKRGEGTSWRFPMGRLSAERHGVEALRQFEQSGQWQLSQEEMAQREREAEATEQGNTPEREEADIVPEVHAAESLAKEYAKTRTGLSEEEQREAMTSVERGKRYGTGEEESEVQEAPPEEEEEEEEEAPVKARVTPTPAKTLAEELHPMKVAHVHDTIRARRAQILTQYADLLSGGKTGEAVFGGKAWEGGQGRIPWTNPEGIVHGPVTPQSAGLEQLIAKSQASQRVDEGISQRQSRAEHVEWLERNLADAVATKSGWDVGDAGRINVFRAGLRQYGKDYPEEFPQHVPKEAELSKYEGDIRTEHEDELDRLSRGGLTAAEQMATAGTVDPVAAAKERAADRRVARQVRAQGVAMVRSNPPALSRQIAGIPEGEGEITNEAEKTIWQRERLKVVNATLAEAAKQAASQVASTKARSEREARSAMKAPERPEAAVEGEQYKLSELIDPETAERLRGYAQVREQIAKEGVAKEKRQRGYARVRAQISEEGVAEARVARGEEWREQERERAIGGPSEEEMEETPYSVSDVAARARQGPVEKEKRPAPVSGVARAERGIAIDVSGMSAVERNLHRRNTGVRDVMGQAARIPAPAPVDTQDTVTESATRGTEEVQGKRSPRRTEPMTDLEHIGATPIESYEGAPAAGPVMYQGGVRTPRTEGEEAAWVKKTR